MISIVGESKNVLNFALAYEGYWTGDGECACFADHPEPRKHSRYGRQDIELPRDPSKRYRVEIQVQAEELDEDGEEKGNG
ncbi:hypothetical protein LCGC14_3066450 [marine sediment metagenome]|uniref:Uncharacterized protein n=1 Tax=marine sediment metagenome TaxID=412755 RepID=A0A0F8WH90_9ZZZZ